MTKVTINPSDEVIAQAQAEVSVTDAKGRTIVLKKPGVLAQYRIVDVLGDSAKNEVYMGMVLPLIFVTSIDGDDVMKPSSRREIDALITRLDDEGVAAVMAGVQEHFGKIDAEGDKQALKK